MNENPDGLPEDFVKSVVSQISPDMLSMYPETDNFIKLYAEFIGFSENQIIPTNGSDMAIRYLLETFGQSGLGEVVTVDPSFEMYRVNCSLLGLTHIPVSYNKDFSFEIGTILDAINDKTNIVVLLNPNNPVGNVFRREDVEKIILKCKIKSALVIIDEAYHYYCKTSFIDFVNKYDNVVILRTFSKMMAMAACRLGVVVSSPYIVDCIKKSKLTFDVNSIALLFGEHLLTHSEIIYHMIAEFNEGKEYLLDVLRRNEYSFLESSANFLLIKTKNNPFIVEDRLKSHKVLIHTFSHSLLKNYIRISIASKRTMNTFIKIFLEVDKL